MKNIAVLSAVLSTSLILSANALLSNQPHHQNQVAMSPQGPGIQLPSQDGPSHPQPNGDVTISDILGGQKAISTFASLTRDINSISSRLEAQSTNTTLLAPVNSAISSLPRKPWENPKDYDKLGTNAYAGNDGAERAGENLKRFVEAHVVPHSPWEEGQKVKMIGGGEVWWEKKGDGRVIMPGKIEVERVAKQVRNGEVWVLKGVLNYAA